MQSRPHSLAELARRAVEEGTDQAFEYELADFLHEFAARTEREMFAERPPLLRDTFGKGSIYDAYLAAIAVYFSGKFHWPTPDLPAGTDFTGAVVRHSRPSHESPVTGRKPGSVSRAESVCFG